MEINGGQKKILLIGGSGFVSGTLARVALDQGHQVWVVTRGQRPLPSGVQPIVVDRRQREDFATAVAGAATQWDLVVDCIGYDRQDAEQDIAVFRQRAHHLVFVSTDFVFDPGQRNFPQSETSEHYIETDYGGKKRQCELVLSQGDCAPMEWTVVRPCHIYGPGSLLGCLPHHGRDPQLVERLQRGEALQLAGGGYFLQQPILAADLALLILSLAGNAKTYGEIFCAAGPDIIESRTYYKIIADLLGVELKIEEVAVAEILQAQPGRAPFLCHRIYDLGKLARCGATVPSTPIATGLRQHLDSLLST